MLVAVFPIHASAQPVVEDVLAFDCQRACVLETHYQCALVVCQVGHHRLRVPAFRNTSQGIGLGAVAHQAPSVERHAHYQFLRRHARLQVGSNGSRCCHPTRDVRGVERRVVLGRSCHIVGHHIHPVEVVDAGREVNICSAGNGSARQQAFVPKRLTQVAHQQGEVPGVVGRRGYACR